MNTFCHDHLDSNEIFMRQGKVATRNDVIGTCIIALFYEIEFALVCQNHEKLTFEIVRIGVGL